MSHMSGRHRSGTCCGIQGDDINLIGIDTQRLRGILRTRLDGFTAMVIGRYNLIDHTYSNPRGMCGAAINTLDRFSALKITIGGNHDKDRALMKWTVGPSHSIATNRNGTCSNFHGLFSRHENIIMNRRTPEARDDPLYFWICRMDDRFHFFLSNRDGPLPVRNERSIFRFQVVRSK